MAQQIQPVEGDVASGSSSSSSQMIKPAHDGVWDRELFLNPESAQIWACTMLCISYHITYEYNIYFIYLGVVMYQRNVWQMKQIKFYVKHVLNHYY